MYALVETRGGIVSGVTLHDTHIDAINRACHIAEQNGLCETDEAKQEVLDALGSHDSYRCGHYRVTVVEAIKT